jgi:hypothetical protein
LPKNPVNRGLTNNAGNTGGFNSNNNSATSGFDNSTSDFRSVNRPTNSVPVNSADYRPPTQNNRRRF